MSAMPAEAEPRRAPAAPGLTALSPTTVALARRPAGLRPRPDGLRLRPVATRTHPVGVRSCSSVPHAAIPGSIPHAAIPAAEPPAATERLPQPAQPLPARAPGRLRLTRRGRVVLTLGVAATASLAWLAAASGAQAASHGVSPGAAQHSVSRVVVQPGQTLWSIATQADPQADPRLVVQQIIAANKLAGGSIVAGQRLVIPHV